MAQSFLTFVIQYDGIPLTALKQCLASIKRQTSTNYEWLVLNNISKRLPNSMCYICARPVYITSQYVMFMDANQVLSTNNVVSELHDLVIKHNMPEIISWEGDLWTTSFSYRSDVYRSITESCDQDNTKCKLADYIIATTYSNLHLAETPIVYLGGIVSEEHVLIH